MMRTGDSISAARAIGEVAVHTPVGTTAQGDAVSAHGGMLRKEFVGRNGIVDFAKAEGRMAVVRRENRIAVFEQAGPPKKRGRKDPCSEPLHELFSGRYVRDEGVRYLRLAGGQDGVDLLTAGGDHAYPGDPVQLFEPNPQYTG